MKISMQKQVSAVMTLGVAVLATGCGGGGQSTPAVPAAAKSNSSAVKTAKAKLTVRIPLRKSTLASNSSNRSPKYVSAFTTELAIQAGAVGTVGTAAWQIFDVSSTATASSLSSCTTDPASLIRTCNIVVTAPAVQGTDDEFRIDATDSTTIATDTVPTGNILSAGDTTETVSVGAPNAVGVSLTSVIGKLSTVKPSYSVWAAPNTSANVVAGIVANDIDGGSIFGQPEAYANPLTFSDGLTGSPFTYPNANPPADYGIKPPETAGPVQATIAYAAPATGIVVPAATVTVGTIVPDYLSLVVPPATFTLDPMVLSVAGAPIGSLSDLVAGTPVIVTVNEPGASNFTVTANTDAQAVLTLSAATVANGGTFTVSPLTATSGAAPAITITDANGTAATLPVVVAAANALPTAPPAVDPVATPTPDPATVAASAHRRAVHR
jgi:hypothetical protein